MGLRKIGRMWYVYWQEEGKYIIRATRCTDRRKAEAVARDMLATVKAYRVQKRLMPSAAIPHPYPSSVVPHSDKGVKLADMFAIASKYRNLSKRHRQIWDRFVNGVRYKYASEITPKAAVTYLDGQQFKSAKTYNNHKTILNTIFRLCFAETTVESPFKSLLSKQLTDVHSHRNITECEFKAILNAATPFWRFMTTLSYYTGMPKEVCLRFCPDMIVEIGGRKWAKYLRGKTARFGRCCQVPLRQEVLDILPSGVTGSTPFCNSFERPTLKEVDHGYKGILTELGIVDTADGVVDFHSLRSSFITNCRAAGIPDHAIRSMVGHVSSETTDIYSHDTETPLQLLKVKQENK